MTKNKIVIFILLVSLSGCATLQSGQYACGDAPADSGWKKIGAAAVKAAKSPYTWVPLVLTGLFQINGNYDLFSDSISKARPVFGSMRNADRWSNIFSGSSNIAFWVSVFAVAPGDSAYSINRLKAAAAGIAAKETNTSLINYLKSATARARPDTRDYTSFPSGHTGKTALNATLFNRNIKELDISSKNKFILRAGSDMLVAGTGWARMEAKRHYITDVLAGISLANFVGLFFYEAFLYNNENNSISVIPSHDSVLVQINKKW